MGSVGLGGFMQSTECQSSCIIKIVKIYIIVIQSQVCNLFVRRNVGVYYKQNSLCHNNGMC